MDIRYFIGIDIAKVSLDWAVYDGKKMVLQTSTPNTIAGIKTALRLLKSLPNWLPQQGIFCMEPTGIYNAHLLYFLHKLHLPIWLDRADFYGLCKGKGIRIVIFSPSANHRTNSMDNLVTNSI